MILIWQNNTVNILFHLGAIAISNPLLLLLFVEWIVKKDLCRSHSVLLLHHETSEFSARCSHNLPIIGTCRFPRRMVKHLQEESSSHRKPLLNNLDRKRTIN